MSMVGNKDAQQAPNQTEYLTSLDSFVREIFGEKVFEPLKTPAASRTCALSQ